MAVADDAARHAMETAVNAEFRKWVATQEELAAETGPYAAAAESLADLAQSLADAGADAGPVVAAARSVLELRRAAARSARGLGRAAAVYAPPSVRPPFAPTDFEAVLADVSGRRGGDDDSAGVGTDVEARLAAVARGGGGGGGDDDDDVVVEGGSQLARNNKCPLTGKQILDLDRPVVDAMGFVYEAAAMQAYMETQGRAPRRGVPREVRCPVAGAAHAVVEGSLKPAVRVERARQAARRGAGRGGGRGRADVIV